MQVPESLVAEKYRLTKLLGRGGMGAVWEGVHTTLGTRVAVKFIDAEHAASEELRQRFVNEAKAAARLRSKHVVQVYDQGVTDDGRPYIVMEFLAGEPLDARLDRLGRLSPEDTAKILSQVSRALSKAHGAGIVHRDLKPENIFLVWDEEDHRDIAKVVDFGIAKFTDRAATTSSGSTRTGAVLGTPHYMSPEQARGLRSLDHRTDIWSLGVIGYRAILGRLPFEGEALGDLLVRICTADPIVPSSIDPSVPPGFDDWVRRALAREPEQRFASATELAEALCSVCGLEGRSAMGSLSSSSGAIAAQSGNVRPVAATHVTEVPLTNTLSGAGNRRPLFIGIGAVGVVGLLALGFLVTSGDDAPEVDASAEALSDPAPPPAAAPREATPEKTKVTPPTASAQPEVVAQRKADDDQPSAEPSSAPPPPSPVVRLPAPRKVVTPIQRAAPKPQRPPPKPAEPSKPPPDLLGY